MKTNKLSEIQSLQKEIEERRKKIRDKIRCNPKIDKECINDGHNDESWWDGDIDMLEAKLSTWKQALTYQLKELDEDIDWLEETFNRIDLSSNCLRDDKSFKKLIKQKLAEKQDKKAEIIKELEGLV